jgi:RNA-directed DNA polymerase
MKDAKWVRKKYFQSEGNLHWIFATVGKADGYYRWLRLFRASTIPIVRHVKIRSAANPFDSGWEAYFARRRAATTSVNVFGAKIWC